MRAGNSPASAWPPTAERDRRVSIDVRLDDAARRTAIARDVRRSLTVAPHRLPPKYFYDAAGAGLFQRIARPARVLPHARGAHDPRRPRRLAHAHAAALRGRGDRGGLRHQDPAAAPCGARGRALRRGRRRRPDDDGRGGHARARVSRFARAPAGRRLRAPPRASAAAAGAPARRVPRQHARQPRAAGACAIPARAPRAPRLGGPLPPRRRLDEGPPHAPCRLRRRPGRDRGVQPQRAPRDQPRARRGLRPRGVPARGARGRDRAAGESIWTESSYKFTRADVNTMLAESGLRLERWLTDRDDRFAVLTAGPSA